MAYGIGQNSFASMQEQFSGTSITAAKAMRPKRKEKEEKKSVGGVIESGIGMGLTGMELAGTLGVASGPVGFGIGAALGVASYFMG